MKLGIEILYLMMNAPMYFIIVSWIIYAVFSRLGKYHKHCMNKRSRLDTTSIFLLFRGHDSYTIDIIKYIEYASSVRLFLNGPVVETWVVQPHRSHVCRCRQLPCTVLYIVSSSDPHGSVAPGCPPVTSRCDRESTLLSIVLPDSRDSVTLLY